MMVTRKKAAKKTAVPSPENVVDNSPRGIPAEPPAYSGPRFEHMTVESPVTQIVARLAQHGAAGWHVVGMSGPTILLERTV